MLNINGKDDSSYRYKMPAVNINVGGKGNGVFTILDNLNDISKAINHPPTLLLKFLSSSFGAISNDEKMSITGIYTASQIQEAIQSYINTFVLCPSCNIPETIPQLKKETKKNILLELKCSACGKISEIKISNKKEEKTKDLIISYLNKNEWIVQNKGNMVIKTVSDESNPFDL